MNKHQTEFHRAIALVKDGDAAFAVLHDLAKAVADPKLFTVTTIETAAGVARRAFSSDPVSYPRSGTKPIHEDDWFRQVHGEQKAFVANTIKEISQRFPDYELINSLGCQSVVNLPVVAQGEVIATVNFLHETGYFTPERVEAIHVEMGLPALTAMLISRTSN